MSYVNPIWAEEQRKRWLRPDWQRWVREDVQRLLLPAEAKAKSEVRRAAIELDELDALLADHARVRRLLAEVKYELAWRRLVRKYNPDQPRVPAGNADGGQWTDGGGAGAAKQPSTMTTEPARLRNLLQLFRIAPVVGVPRAVENALRAYSLLSSKNALDARAVLEFNAREFQPGAEKTDAAAHVGVLTSSEVDAACKKFDTVQQLTNEAARQNPREDYASPQARGTAIHTWIRDAINGPGKEPRDPNFRSELSVAKSDKVDYGERGSVRIDVYENPRNGTVCIYDIKTGDAGLSFARMQELANNVHQFYPTATRILVTEVRPEQ